MKNVFLYMGLAVATLFSCQKYDNPKPLTFDVSVEATTVRVGDPVTFNFVGGDANQISFYSGDIGNNYEYRDKNRTDEIKKLFFSFQTHNSYDDNIHLVRPDVFISTDFNGLYDYENVSSANANWIPLSEFFTWGLPGPWSAMWMPSGPLDITEYIKDKPFYLAFRAISDARPPADLIATRKHWRASNTAIMAETLSGDYMQVVTFAGMDWRLVDKYLSEEEIPIQSYTQRSSSILLLGYYRADSPRFGLDSEVWGVSQKMQISSDINLGTEGAISLKQYIDQPLESHTYYYDTPGVYKVVFIASNSTMSGTKTVMKELEITVLP